MLTMSNVNTNSMTHDEQCLENAIKKQLRKYIGRVECICPTSDTMESQDDFDYLLWAFKRLNLRDKVVMQLKQAISQYEKLTARNLFPSITSSLKECQQKIDSKQTLIKAMREYVENGKLSVLYELYFYLVNRHEPNQNHEPRLYSRNTYGGCMYVLSCDETFTKGGTRLLWMDIERYEPNDSNTGTKLLFCPRPKEDNFDNNESYVLHAVKMFFSSLDTKSYINVRNRLDGLKCIRFSVGLDKGYSGRSIRAALTFMLISYLLELPLYPRIAITGDLDDQGSILDIAGIGCKTKAGIEEGIELICFPGGNWNELQSALPINYTNQGSQSQLVRIRHISQLVHETFKYLRQNFLK
uniref:Lon proteolytic domain-containing protein n=1 Tax=Acrobeloides nanus TaxID=290746 RepID=A0A914BYW1_9BILA